MTMLGRGKKKPDDKAAKAEEAAKLAEEAAAKAREAARLAQIAADEAAAAGAEEAEEPEKAAKSPEKPRKSRKAAKGEPAPEDASEADSAAAADSETGDETAEDDETVAGGTVQADDEDVADEDEADEADEDEKPAKPARLKSKKAAKAVADDDEEDEPRRSRRVGGLSTVIAVLAVLTIALGAGTTVLYLKVSEQKATEQAGKDASMASSRAAQKLSSYDYQTLDADLKAASATTTGKLHTDYEKLAQELRTVAVQQQAVSNTTVMKVGVVSASPDKVVTLVYANRSSVTKDDKQQRLPEPLRIKMTMVNKDGKWLASELTVIS
ncbi:hypothetical protein [Actinomadura latina]|uniref:Mce-associated membrane protein n=1 Tax=Actinomadura latina TaxID=163603 RepID=A0A846YV65_9ACTN|nr:hypothetical protein [Actinomadura latina]NKZ02542.1 hypothetical protein [Actinomadura latina]